MNIYFLYKKLFIYVVILVLSVFAIPVIQVEAAVTATLGVSASNIVEGDTVRVSWSSSGADSCTGSGFSTDGATLGYVDLTPVSDTTYSVICEKQATIQESCTPGIGFEFDGWCSTDPAGNTVSQCSHHNIGQIMCGSALGSSCNLRNVDFKINTCAVCNVDFDVCRTTTVPASSDSDLAIVQVAVPTPEPTASITVTPSTLEGGGDYTISWSSTNSTSCAGDAVNGFFTGGETSGSLTLNTSISRTHTVRCSGAGGADTATDSVAVNPVVDPVPTDPVDLEPEPTASLVVSPTSIVSGDPTNLTWSSTNSTNCTLGGFFSNGDISGIQEAFPTSDTTYTLWCSGPGGTTSTTATVSVAAAVTTEPTASITVTPSTLEGGGDYTISWSSTNSTSCAGDAVNGFFTGGETSGSLTLNTSISRTHTVRCSGAGGADTATDSVAVNPVVDPVPTDPVDPLPDPVPTDPVDPLPDPVPTDPVDPLPDPVPANCVFNGSSVQHGDSVTAYRVNSVDYDTRSCSSERQSRTCTDGTLSGSYNHNACIVENPIPTDISCSKNNETFAECSGIYTLVQPRDPLYVLADNTVERWYQCGVENGVTLSFIDLTRSNNARMNFGFDESVRDREFHDVSICLDAVNAEDPTRKDITIKLLNFSFNEE